MVGSSDKGTGREKVNIIPPNVKYKVFLCRTPGWVAGQVLCFRKLKVFCVSDVFSENLHKKVTLCNHSFKSWTALCQRSPFILLLRTCCFWTFLFLLQKGLYKLSNILYLDTFRFFCKKSYTLPRSDFFSHLIITAIINCISSDVKLGSANF